LDIFEKLNPEQRLAVETTDGPLLILSGAGTGKTRVLTSKIAYILAQGLARPWNILAVTFTNTAANEMKNRVKAMIGDDMADGLWIGTFHSVGFRWLKKYPELAGLKPGFIIYDEDDQKILVRKTMEEDFGLDVKRYNPMAVLEQIQRFKDKGIYFGQATLDAMNSDFVNGELLGIYKRYQERLIELNAADFGDLLLYPLMIFEQNPAVLAELQDKFRYILVDEYQDTNAVQYKLLKLLSARHRNIACVGDDDQSIYSWRGAEIENILKFEQDFPGAKVIRLETNYRSTPHILRAASGLISKNFDRLGKTLRPCGAANDDCAKVAVKGVWSGEEEARQIIDQIEHYQRRGIDLSQMAVLVRAGYQTRIFEEKLVRSGIPYKIIGGLKFYERQEIKDAIAYLRLLAHPQDNLSFERIINVPRRGIGDKALAEIAKNARLKHMSYFESARDMGRGRTKQAGMLKQFTDGFDRWRAAMEGAGDEGPADPSALARTMLEESGYMDMWKSSKKIEAEAKLQNIMEFLGILKSDFSSISEFLEYVTLFTENNAGAGQDMEYLSLMTLHSAKGLEFDAVFLPGWEMGIFPNDKAMQEGGVEEERRLAYVGITRAKKFVEIYYAGSRQVFGQWQHNMPSMFLGELPKDAIDYTGFSDAIKIWP
jgi:DNA helicase-2/ATP-dependent DNA helicase PcrA